MSASVRYSLKRYLSGGKLGFLCYWRVAMCLQVQRSIQAALRTSQQHQPLINPYSTFSVPWQRRGTVIWLHQSVEILYFCPAEILQMVCAWPLRALGRHLLGETLQGMIESSSKSRT